METKRHNVIAPSNPTPVTVEKINKMENDITPDSIDDGNNKYSSFRFVTTAPRRPTIGLAMQVNNQNVPSMSTSWVESRCLWLNQSNRDHSMGTVLRCVTRCHIIPPPTTFTSMINVVTLRLNFAKWIERRGKIALSINFPHVLPSSWLQTDCWGFFACLYRPRLLVFLLRLRVFLRYRHYDL